MNDQIARMILASAYAAKSFSLTGSSRDARASRYWNRVTSPRIGDWVFESSSIAYAMHYQDGQDANRNPTNYVGRLVAIEWESPWHDPDDETLHPVAMEFKVDGVWKPSRPEFWTIETISGERFRWHNCDMVVIPDQISGFPGLWETHK